ncbi:50S ribosomal protein L10 [Candidatus Omnitrophota bacterium]
MKKLGILLRESLQNELKDRIASNNNAFVIGYSSVSASDFNDLRITLKDSGAHLTIMRNSLAKRVFKETQLSETMQLIEGPTALVWDIEDPVIVSKKLKTFAKDHTGLIVKGGYLDKKIIGQDTVKTLADLPTKETLQAMAINAIKYPITGLFNALNHNLRQVLNILKKIGEEKGGS